MAGMTREEIAHVVGPALDDSVILEIIATAASKVELEEAVAWLMADDATTRDGRARNQMGLLRSCVKHFHGRKSRPIASKTDAVRTAASPLSAVGV